MYNVIWIQGSTVSDMREREETYTFLYVWSFEVSSIRGPMFLIIA